jgi:hypothetical protein
MTLTTLRNYLRYGCILFGLQANELCDNFDILPFFENLESKRFKKCWLAGLGSGAGCPFRSKGCVGVSVFGTLI